MTRTLLAGALALALSVPAHAATFTPIPWANAVRVSGFLEPGDPERFLEAVKQIPGSVGRRVTLVLNTGGGNLNEAYVLANVIRDVRQAGFVINTLVPHDGYCASACIVIFAAGQTKYVEAGGIVGVHSIADLYPDGTKIDSRAWTTQVASDLGASGAPPAVVNKQVQTPNSSISWLTPADLAGWGVITLPAGQALREHSAGRLGIPVVDAGKGAEERPANEHPVKMADDEIGVADLVVERHQREHDARQTADQEHRQKADGKQHRRRERDFATIHGGQPVEHLDARWN